MMLIAADAAGLHKYGLSNSGDIHIISVSLPYYKSIPETIFG